MTEEPISNNIPYVTIFEIGYINQKGVAVPSPFRMYDLSLRDIYYYIRSDKAKKATEELRAISDHSEAQRFKALNFYTMTPAGIFNYRKANRLYRHSKLMVIDIDGIASHKRLLEIRDKLLKDETFETEMLFISPSGNGLKWIICVGEQTKESHSATFAIVKDYLQQTYDVDADKSGSDVSRICYLPYDPDCYINPEFLSNEVHNKNCQNRS